MSNEVFKQKVEINEDTLKIHVSCELRVHATVHKEIYKESDLVNCIPEELKDKVNLVSSPDKQVSNIDKPHFSNSGTWVFSIIKEKPNHAKEELTTAKQSTRKKTSRPTRRRSTAAKK